MENKGIVLSDDLLKEYLNFRSGKEFDVQLIKKIINYLKGGVFFNFKQLKKIGVMTKEDFNVFGIPGLWKQILRSNNKDTLEDLSKKSVFKIILSDNETKFPYVNIYNDVIENNLCGFFYPGHDRDKAIEHIRTLCLDAKEIVLFDKFFHKKRENIDTLIKILPDTDLQLIYYRGGKNKEKYLTKNQKKQLKSKRNNITLYLKDDPKNIHDRYLLIDKKIEVILTSGFYHLGKHTNDFAYIIRKVDNDRFSPSSTKK
ncbi:MAG: hypothetical protein WA945_00350 [Arcobacteraceae bacterium]